MPYLRKRLGCFYCGKKATQFYTPGLKKFDCEHCEAENWLDSHGNITDPPARSTSSSITTQYAQPSRRPSPFSEPPSQTTNEPLFCAICTKNQHIVNIALAEYLPADENDPEYKTREETFGEYRRTMELNYPQCCDNCAPQVRRKIQAAGYAAKTDDLRRMMQRTKYGTPVAPGSLWSIKGLLLVSGMLCWWSSVIGQLLWHAIGALVIPTSTGPNWSHDLDPYSCYQLVRTHKRVGWDVFSYFTQFVPVFLLLGLISIWWHGTLRQRMYTLGGRMVGQAFYWRYSFIALVLRAGVVWTLQSRGIFTPTAFNAVHLMGILILSFSTIYATRIVRIDFRPRFTLNKDIEPLIPAQARTTQPTTTPFAAPSTSPRSFPLSKLASASTSAPHDPFNLTALASRVSTRTSALPPSPPHSSDDDTMDWQPTSAALPQKQLTTNPIRQPSTFQPLPVAPTTFRTPVPAAPKHKLHQFLNPWGKPPAPPPARDSTTSFHDIAKEHKRKLGELRLRPSRQRGEMEMGLGTLRLDGGGSRSVAEETGLEKVMDEMFSISETGRERRGGAGGAGSGWKGWVLVLGVGGLGGLLWGVYRLGMEMGRTAGVGVGVEEGGGAGLTSMEDVVPAML